MPPGRHSKVTGSILIYGVTGYTGKRLAGVAREQGLKPILAGRNSETVRAVAEPLGLAWRGFDLLDSVKMDVAMNDVAVVLCAAGPFSATSRPMADACIRNRVHYLDIIGEIDVFEALAARDAEAKGAGVCSSSEWVSTRHDLCDNQLQNASASLVAIPLKKAPKLGFNVVLLARSLRA
jgi:short subunit dehydrogenase-like uncharacterized protein